LTLPEAPALEQGLSIPFPWSLPAESYGRTNVTFLGLLWLLARRRRLLSHADFKFFFFFLCKIFSTVKDFGTTQGSFVFNSFFHPVTFFDFGSYDFQPIVYKMKGLRRSFFTRATEFFSREAFGTSFPVTPVASLAQALYAGFLIPTISPQEFPPSIFRLPRWYVPERRLTDLPLVSTQPPFVTVVGPPLRCRSAEYLGWPTAEF